MNCCMCIMLMRGRKNDMIEISICIGSACHLRGSYNVIQIFQQKIEEHALHDQINFKSAFCMKQCQNKGVTVAVNGNTYNILPENAGALFQSTVLPLVK